METSILDGQQLATQRKHFLQQKVTALLEKGLKPVVAAILFAEDAGSVLYADLKREMAEELGIEYQVHTFSLLDGGEQLLAKIQELNQDDQLTGIIIQKPWRNHWLTARKIEGEAGKQQFAEWWQQLVMAIEPSKDIDGLHPTTLTAIQAGNWQEQRKVLPATCQAVLALAGLAFALEREQSIPQYLKEHSLKTVILGKSDLLGQPLFALLQSNNCSVEMIGSAELKERIEQGILLKDADLIISATGRKNLVTGEMIKAGAVVIDVGEPQGDVDLKSVLGKARAVSPVPGGVGPMTVVSLLENVIEVAQKR